MTACLLVLTIFVVAVSCSSDSATSGGTNDAGARIQRPPMQEISFEADVLPILSEGCRPCHFEGGKMYEKLPFDRPGTIRKLGDLLFTRIKEEQQRAVVRSFLAGTEKRAP